MRLVVSARATYRVVQLVSPTTDGYSGLAGEVWGQPGWRPSRHEEGWALLNVFYPGAGDVNTNVGMEDVRRSRFAGTPHGLADIVPAETPAHLLARYRTLLFLGWNTMNDAQYSSLTEYVRGGGRVIMWASHLNGSARREDVDVRHRFYRGGDFQDLFGVRVRMPKADRRKRDAWRPLRTHVNSVTWVKPSIYGFPVGKTYYLNWPHGGVESELQNSCHLVHQNSDYLNENRIGYGPIPKVFGRRR